MNPTPRRLNVGILGCGGVAHRWYLPGLSGKKQDYELVAVADINLNRAKEAAQEYKVPFYYNSLRDLISHPRMDLIVVLTRHKDHFNHVKEILNHKIHVYCEKPLAETTDQVRQLIVLARHNRRHLGAAPQVMLSSRNKRIKELVTQGKIGNITLARISGSNMGPADRKGVDYDPEWFYQDGGSLKSLGIYNLAATLYIFGRPKVVVGFSGISIPKRTVMYGPYKGKRFVVKAPDNEVAMLDYGNAVYVLFDGSYSVRTPPKYEFEIHGTGGSIFAGGFGGKESVVLKGRGKKEIKVGPNDDCHIKWTLAWGVEETIRAIQDGRPTKTSADFALMTIEVIDAIRDSQKFGKHITL